MLTKKTKILFVLHYPPPVHGSSTMGKLIKDSEIINQTFFCNYINLGTSSKIDEIGKHSLKKVIRYFSLIKKIFIQLVKFRPDLCYFAITAKGMGFFKDALLTIIIKLTGVKMVFHFHNKGVKFNQHRIIDNILYKIVFNNSQVILVSKLLYSDIEKYVTPQNVHYCSNGIPFIRLDNKLIKQSKDDNENVKVLFLSNLIESKGVFILLDACRILTDNNIKYQCYFVGGEGNISKHQFNKEIEKRGLKNTVKYLGAKFGEDKYELYLNSDIFVFPTYNDTFGLVNLEAMQFSLPIVSTYEGGIPDVIEDGVTGFLVPQKNVIVLAKKLETLIMNSNLRFRMGTAGRLKYEKEFTSTIFENQLKDILIKITNR